MAVNSISRRTFLRGAAGTILTLPWMESLAAYAPLKNPAQRFATFYVPIGVIRSSFFPGEEDAEPVKFKGGAQKLKPKMMTTRPPGEYPLTLTETMQPLEKIKEHVSLITGLDRIHQAGTDVHAQCASCFMSSAAPFEIKSSAWPLDRTLDHVIGDVIGGDAPFRTFEFSCNSYKDNKESIYFDNISWYGTGHVAPSMRDPRKAYRRMFRTGDTESFRNITDLVLEDAHSLERKLGYADRKKFWEYFESIRTIEKQMDRLESMKSELKEISIQEPVDTQLPRGEYIRLMADLMIVALQTGLTNVATMMIGPERWDTPLLFESLFDKPVSHHQMSHNIFEWKEQLKQIDYFYMQQYAYMLEKMASIEEANGSTLLDNTIFTYGSGLGDGTSHQYDNLPIIVAGKGGGKLKTGQHIQVSVGTPLANLWLTQARAMGVKLERFAESTETVSSLIDPAGVR